MLGVAVLIAGALGPLSAEDIRVGHWIEARGDLADADVLLAVKVEIMAPEKQEILIGTVPEDTEDAARFWLLGQEVHTSAKTEWDGVTPGSLPGSRVKIEGYYRGPRNFSAREVKARNPGRDRVGGRVDEIRRTERGLELTVMRYTVLLAPECVVEVDGDLASLPLAPERVRHRDPSSRDEDDVFGEGIRLTDRLFLTGQLEARSTGEEDFDLDQADAADRRDDQASIRARFSWLAGDDLTVVGSFRSRGLFRHDEEDGDSDTGTTVLGETFVQWSDVLGSGADLIAGRQDFDDRREWLYDQNLDAVRGLVSTGSVDLELSVSTTLSDGSERDENSTNWIGYVSNKDSKRHLAGYAIHRDIDLATSESLTHVGVRALGEWWPDHRSWGELSHLRGSRGTTDVEGWAYDVGTTWSPGAVDPFYFTAGYALATGDDDPAAGRDTGFRQTGLQDNNSRFGGVTSFRYYGELLQPELANLGILTLGVGVKLGRRTSIDLVYHDYRQDVIGTKFHGADIDASPNGSHAHLGREIDLIFGSRHWKNWDFEVVFAHFDPGDAFDEDDDAFLTKFQARYRF